jgi:hypothetical protein
MSAVTFIPVKDKIYLTCNRDEKKPEAAAIWPTEYTMKNCRMIFPKLTNTGGSWMAICSNGNAGVLLFDLIKKNPEKINSIKRELVFIDIMDNARPLHFFLKMPLEGIPPFTLILWQYNNLYECRWDDHEKHCWPLRAYRPYIWSSSALYRNEIRKKRELWLCKWLNKYPSPTKADVYDFHHCAGDGNQENGIFMKGNAKISTISITGLELTAHKGIMNYVDFIGNNTVEISRNFSSYLTMAS